MVRSLAGLSRLAPRPLLAMQKINSNAQDQTYVSHRNCFIECACLDGAPSRISVGAHCDRRRILLFAMRPMASLHPYARFAPALCAMSVPAMRYVHAMPYLCTTPCHTCAQPPVCPACSTGLTLPASRVITVRRI